MDMSKTQNRLEMGLDKLAWKHFKNNIQAHYV